MLERLKNRWHHKADSYDEDKFLSKEWFLSILIAVGFFAIIATVYLIISLLIGEYKADLLFDFLLAGMVVAMVAFAWGLNRK